jgi:hypothetical protein
MVYLWRSLGDLGPKAVSSASPSLTASLSFLGFSALMMAKESRSLNDYSSKSISGVSTCHVGEPGRCRQAERASHLWCPRCLSQSYIGSKSAWLPLLHVNRISSLITDLTIEKGLKVLDFWLTLRFDESAGWI